MSIGFIAETNEMYYSKYTPDIIHCTNNKGNTDINYDKIGE